MFDRDSEIDAEKLFGDGFELFANNHVCILLQQQYRATEGSARRRREDHVCFKTSCRREKNHILH